MRLVSGFWFLVSGFWFLVCQCLNSVDRFGAGFDLLKANAIKVLIVLAFTVVALVVFIANSQVNYLIGLMLGAGSMLGAWIATRVAVKQGTKFIRWFLLGAVFVFAVKLLVW